jgi:bifunctional non-homologous end joining protein LigD
VHERTFTIDHRTPLPAERDGEHWWVEGDGFRVRLSNLDKVYWPRDGYTKGDLLAYYWNVAGPVLDHIRDRPLTLKRMPEGIDGSHFYQKDAPDHTPEWIPRCAIEPEDGEIDEMVLANRPEHLLFVANLGAIEMHPLHSRCESYDRPDYMVFDLDPFPPAGFDETLIVAQHVKVALDNLGLRGYPKTSGATGIQIYVPVAGHTTYAETRALAGEVGRNIRRADPDLVTMDWEVSERRGVFIDYTMNRRAASLASAYSVRPLDGAPVSAPLTWDEIETGDADPDWFRMDNIGPRLAEMGDLFADLTTGGQDLSEILVELGLHPEDEPEEQRIRQRMEPSKG